jgi:hypothetical protein
MAQRGASLLGSPERPHSQLLQERRRRWMVQALLRPCQDLGGDGIDDGESMA